MEEVERIELSSKRLPRKALQLVETITPPRGREVQGSVYHPLYLFP